MDHAVSLDEASPREGHNISDRLKAFLQSVDDLGRQSALGTTALAELVRRVIDAATVSLIKPDQAKQIYERYAAASKNAGGTPGSISSNASKLRKIIELCNQNHTAKLVDDAVRMRGEVSNAKSLLDGLAELARYRLKAQRNLTDNEIKTALTKKPKAKSEAKPKPVAYKIPWMEIIASKDRAGLVALRDEIDTCIRVMDQSADEVGTRETDVDAAAPAPSAAVAIENAEEQSQQSGVDER